MARIQLTTEIAAPIERCFDLSRSIDLHIKSVDWSSEQAVAGVTTGLISSGEEVTWRARHFGVMISHTSRITAYESPIYFQDAMIRGVFRSFCHDHYFEARGLHTIMRDDVKFAAPLGILGVIAEKALVERHMRGLLLKRNAEIKRAAESEDWKNFLK
ncbi:MAG TPA: SRPBCC family protein [Terriglobales bacterium]|jgi:ligand-binding SRPBCC domain-containing protein|nr:SRPBCC family protein [Terriglobales bacterium]